MFYNVNKISTKFINLTNHNKFMVKTYRVRITQTTGAPSYVTYLTPAEYKAKKAQVGSRTYLKSVVRTDKKVYDL